MRKLVLPLLGVLLVGVLATPALAKSYQIDTADVDIVVNSDASLSVTEQLTYDFSGSFSGAYRDIPLRQGESISNVTVTDARGVYQLGGCVELGCFSPRRDLRASHRFRDTSALSGTTRRLTRNACSPSAMTCSELPLHMTMSSMSTSRCGGTNGPSEQDRSRQESSFRVSHNRGGLCVGASLRHRRIHDSRRRWDFSGVDRLKRSFRKLGRAQNSLPHQLGPGHLRRTDDSRRWAPDDP